jgi:hypothetical protein
MKWAGHAARVGEVDNTRFQPENLKERGILEFKGTRGWIIFKYEDSTQSGYRNMGYVHLTQDSVE